MRRDSQPCSAGFGRCAACSCAAPATSTLRPLLNAAASLAASRASRAAASTSCSCMSAGRQREHSVEVQMAFEPCKNVACVGSMHPLAGSPCCTPPPPRLPALPMRPSDHCVQAKQFTVITSTPADVRGKSSAAAAQRACRNEHLAAVPSCQLAAAASARPALNRRGAAGSAQAVCPASQPHHTASPIPHQR